MRPRQTRPIAALICLGLMLATAVMVSEAGADSEADLLVTPLARYIAVAGDEDKFREDWWMDEDWAGGLEAFTLKRGYENGVSLQLEGRAIIPDEDYRVRLDLSKEDVGFVRAGYRGYRKYYDDTGGFFAPFAIPSFALDQDLRLDIGDIYAEVGLAFPEWPSVVLGYERAFKDGSKSLLEWGSVTEDGVTRKLFPSFKDVDETVDIYRADIRYEIGDVRMQDLFRYERAAVDTTRVEQERNLDTGASESVSVAEGYQHDAVYNTFHIDGHVNDKVYLSLGHLLSNLEGDSYLRMFTLPFGPEPFDKDWFTRSVDIDQNSHVLNLNAMLGPFRDLTFCAGMEAETTESEGDTDAVLLETSRGGGIAEPEADIRSRTDKGSLEETMGLRYTGLAYTTLYAEGRWTQQDIDLDEQETEDALPVLDRATDTRVDRQRYSVGFDTAPIDRLKLSGQYRWNYRKYDYDHTRDTEPGYSAFITRQELTTDELSAKATFRFRPGVTASLQYQLVRTEIETGSETTPPSSVPSGDYKADIYTASVTYIPIARLYLTGLLSFRDIRSQSFDNGAEVVVPYKGNVCLLMGTAGCAIDNTTDLTLKLLYSRSDNFSDTSASGLPLGLDNDRIGLAVEFAKQLSPSSNVRLQYGFYRYDEDSNGGVDDYTAHLLGVSWAYRF